MMEYDGFYVRMAEPFDAPALDASFRSSDPRQRATSSGFLDFPKIIQNSLYPLLCLSIEDEVLAFASFNDLPTVPGSIFGKKAADALHWGSKHAGEHGFTSEDSLWLEACASCYVDKENENKFLQAFLATIFRLSPETKAILAICPSHQSKVLGILNPICESPEQKLLLLACLQSTILPVVNIKQAVEENYDDLCPIVESAQEKVEPLSKVPDSAHPEYPYAVARLIAAQDDKNSVLVAQVDDKLVGMIAVTHEVNYDVLAHFNLDIYEGLTSSTKDVGMDMNYNDGYETINAFQITMFCLDSEFHHKAIDLLMSTFTHENKEYCIVEMPFDNPPPYWLQYFTRVPRKANITTEPQVMVYILNKKSLDRGFEVVLVKPQDVASFKNLLEDFQDRNVLLEYMEHPRKGCTALVAIGHDRMLGLALIEEECPSEAIFSHFDVRKFVNVNVNQQNDNTQSVIVHFVLNPLFANRRKLFLREIMRQTGKSVLYMPVFSRNDVSDVIHDMILVPGRWHASMATPCMWWHVSNPVSPGRGLSFRSSRMIQTGVNRSTTHKTGPYFGFDCALFVLTHKLLSRSRALVNDRIIVVGASQAGVACLNKLITSVNFKFSNLTLISPYGLKALPVNRKALFDVEQGPAYAFPKLGLDCLVNVITSTVVELNRKEKCIYLSDGTRIQYDYLILTPGLQDQTRTKLRVGLNKGVVRFDELAMMIDDNDSCFLQITEMDLPVVIYGLSLETFCSIQALLAKGIPGNQVIVVFPELQTLDSYAQKCFGESYIATLVMREIRQAGVIVRPGFELLEVYNGESTGYRQFLRCVAFKDIEHVDKEKENVYREPIEQPCYLLVACTERHVDTSLFKAFLREGLVFNGRIVINGRFQTNDPHIFACGSLCKFSRTCGKHPHLEMFNSFELGRHLGNSILSLFSEHLPNQNNLQYGLLPFPFDPPPHEYPRIAVPHLKQAKAVGALLPGNLIYFDISCPNQYSNTSKAAQTITMGKEDSMLKLEFKQSGVIVRAIYCGKDNLEAWKFVRLVGCYEPLLSNIAFGRLKNNMSLVELFSQQWFTFVFHDKFFDVYNDLCMHVYEILQDSPMDEKQVKEAINAAFTLFFSAYKADFPGAHFTAMTNVFETPLGYEEDGGRPIAKARRRDSTEEEMVSNLLEEEIIEEEPEVEIIEEKQELEPVVVEPSKPDTLKVILQGGENDHIFLKFAIGDKILVLNESDPVRIKVRFVYGDDDTMYLKMYSESGELLSSDPVRVKLEVQEDGKVVVVLTTIDEYDVPPEEPVKVKLEVNEDGKVDVILTSTEYERKKPVHLKLGVREGSQVSVELAPIEDEPLDELKPVNAKLHKKDDGTIGVSLIPNVKNPVKVKFEQKKDGTIAVVLRTKDDAKNNPVKVKLDMTKDGKVAVVLATKDDQPKGLIKVKLQVKEEVYVVLTPNKRFRFNSKEKLTSRVDLIHKNVVEDSPEKKFIIDVFSELLDHVEVAQFVSQIMERVRQAQIV